MTTKLLKFDQDIEVKELTVSMKWTTAVDFDLAAVYESNEGQRGLVYFGNLGNLELFPYIQLNKDDGVDDGVNDGVDDGVYNKYNTSGANEELLQINRLYYMNYVWIFCWDYDMVQAGKAARFKESDVCLTMSYDDTNKHQTVEINTGERGNVYYIANIDNTHTMGARLIHTNIAGRLNGLKTLEQLMALV